MVDTFDVKETYWDEPAEKLAGLMRTSLTEGLSDSEIPNRLKQFGPNQLDTRRSNPPLFIFLNQFKSPIVLILVFATIVSAIVQDWADSLIILGIVLVSALLSFYQEYNANSAAEKLRAQVTIKSIVLRGGKQQNIPAAGVVPGDIVLLSAGSIIPADGIVFESRDLFVNQSVLTGETFPVEKKPGPLPSAASLPERTNTVFMGTNVRSGSGQVLVIQTGTRTVFGQIAHRLTLRPPETEFERGIRRLGYLLTEIMLLLVITIFALNVYFHKPALDSLLFSIALAVGLTPQLLPAIIEINLSKGARTMAEAGVIVRRLSSIENFGSMSVLCTDKTGTLTEGVVRMDRAVDSSGAPSDDVFLYAYLNASLQTGLVNPMDEAITARECPQSSRFTKIDEIPYDFIRKRLTVVVCEYPEHCDRQIRLITKGALESVLAICSHVSLGGENLPLDSNLRDQIHEHYEEWSAQGYRVIGLATRIMSPKDVYHHEDESDLVFLGFLLFFDPPKAGVKETVEDLEQMGIQLKIITGDNRLVAKHVMETLGIPVQGILTGAQIQQMNDEAFWHAAAHSNVFAEVDPNQKERIILALKKMGAVVGYMGDGVNDAPALHSADVGISVDSAVDVAKDAAEFVLLRHDLNVLKDGVIQGRRTFANTLKYIFMATSANFGNMFSVAGASLFLSYLPMLPKQILLINLLTDLPEMTIAGDRVDSTYIERPHRWDIQFIRRFMLIFGPLSSVFDFATFGLLLLVLKANQDLFRTGWFIESVLSASVVVFALRTRLPLFRNLPSTPLMCMTAGVALLAMVFPYLPFAGLFGFAPLPAPYLLAILGIVLTYLVSAELVKRWFFKRDSSTRA